MEKLVMFNKNEIDNIISKIIVLFRDKNIYRKNLKEYVEKRISDNLGYCCRKNISVNDWKPDSSFINIETGKGLNQKSVFLSARTFDLWEEGLINVLNKKIKEINLNLDVIPSYNTTHDLKIVYNHKNKNKQDIMLWEVKTTLSPTSKFTGVTHGKHKCNNYFLIQYVMDKDLKLSDGNNENFIKSMFVIMWDNMQVEWKGEPSSKSSFTDLAIPSDIILEKPEIVVLGKTIIRRKNNNLLKYAKFVHEKFID